jgi:hypothetical protein
VFSGENYGNDWELKQRRRRLIPCHLFSAILDWRKTRGTWRSLFFFPLVVLSLSLSLSLSLFFPFISFGRQFLTVPFCSSKRPGSDEQHQLQFFTVRFRSSKAAGREQQQERITENGKRLICSREEREEKEKQNKKVCGERVLEFEVRRSFSLHFAFCLCNNREFVRQESVC